MADLIRYGLATLSVGLALGASLLLEHFHFRGSFTSLSGGLKFRVWRARTYGPESMIAFHRYFVEPVRTNYIYPSEIPYFIILIAFVVLLSWFALIRRCVEADVRRSRDTLREQPSLLSLTHAKLDWIKGPDGAAEFPEFLGVKHTTLLCRMNKWGINKAEAAAP